MCYFDSNGYNPINEKYLIIKEREEKISGVMSLRKKRRWNPVHSGKTVFTWSEVHLGNNRS